MWQAVEVKGQAVKALMRRHTSQPRLWKTLDGLVLSASEAKALASGNPSGPSSRGAEERHQHACDWNGPPIGTSGRMPRGQIKRLERAIQKGTGTDIPRMEVDARLAQADTKGRRSGLSRGR